MILLGIFIFISAVAVLSIRAISVVDSFWASVWWVTCALSLFRIACLWVGHFSMKTTGLGQVFGYFMVLCTLPEALLVRQIREWPILWASMISVLVPIGSFLWVFFLGCIVSQETLEGTPMIHPTKRSSQRHGAGFLSGIASVARRTAACVHLSRG